MLLQIILTQEHIGNRMRISNNTISRDWSLSHNACINKYKMWAYEGEPKKEKFISFTRNQERQNIQIIVIPQTKDCDKNQSENGLATIMDEIFYRSLHRADGNSFLW